jgi:hypothetical protein
MSAPRRPRAGVQRSTDTRLDALIDEAIVDCHDESEQVSGFFTMLEDGLALPFETTLLGVRVTVERIEMIDGDRIAALCARGGAVQLVALESLPLPSPLPQGAEWVEAWRRWLSRR